MLFCLLKDFPNLPWFLGYCFGTPAPDGSMVESCRDVTGENVNKLLEKHDMPYSHVKQLQGDLSDESKGRIAQTDKLDQILWWVLQTMCVMCWATIVGYYRYHLCVQGNHNKS
jgi:hypothetical protein